MGGATGIWGQRPTEMASDTSSRGGGGVATLTMLPRRLLLRLPLPVLALWQSASKPRMPPTPSPISTTWGERPGQCPGPAPRLGWSGLGGTAFVPQSLTCPQKPVPSEERRKAA